MLRLPPSGHTADQREGGKDRDMRPQVGIRVQRPFRCGGPAIVVQPARFDDHHAAVAAEGPQPFRDPQHETGERPE